MWRRLIISIRVFVGIEIPLQIKELITQVTSTLKPHIPNAKWINKDSIHLTLKFLGNVPEEQVCDIELALNRSVNEFRHFYFSLSNFGAFPNNHKARVLWLGISHGAIELAALSESIEQELVPLGFEPEDRGFKAHLTLARLRQPASIEHVLPLLSPTDYYGRIVNVREIVLFKSTLKSTGVVYSAISRVHLNP